MACGRLVDTVSQMPALETLYVSLLVCVSVSKRTKAVFLAASMMLSGLDICSCRPDISWLNHNCATPGHSSLSATAVNGTVFSFSKENVIMRS